MSGSRSGSKMKSHKKQVVEYVRQRTGSQVKASLVNDAQYDVWRGINHQVYNPITKRVRNKVVTLRIASRVRS